MTLTRYESVPSGVSAESQGDAHSDAEDGARSSRSSSERSDDGNDKPEDATDEPAQGKARVYMNNTWASIKALWDDKPYEVRDSWGNVIWHMSKRLITSAVLLSALVFGAAGTSFDIVNRTLWEKFQLNQDAQLAALGILNTILAHMGRDALAHISDTLITRRMVVEDGHGATVLDFEMKEELSKPWVALSNMWAKRKHRGWTTRNVLRYTLSFVIGTCLLLQGAGMNTIGLPKERWWPDTRAISPKPGDDRFFFRNKTMRVASVSTSSAWDRSWNMIREGGDVSWELAHMFAAFSSIESLEHLYETAARDVGWYDVGAKDRPIRTVLNVTDTSTPSIQAAAIDGRATAQMWDEQRRFGATWARRAVGWYATLKLTSLLLDTACAKDPGHEVGSWKASSGQNGTLKLAIGPMMQSSDASFPGATCTVSIKQVVIAIQQWIVRNSLDRDNPGWSIDNWGAWAYPEITPLPNSTASDSDGIAAELADWFNAVWPNLQTLSANAPTANLTSITMQLASAIVQLDRGHDVMDGLAMVVAVLLCNLLTTFSWRFEELHGAADTIQGPVRWEIFGSGPRLEWQWAIAAVLGFNLVVQLFDIFLLLVYRQARGLWLGLGGMLVAANASDRMAPVTPDQGVGFVGEKGKYVRYYVREADGDGDDDARAMLVSECEVNRHTVSLRTGRVYGVKDD